MNTSLPRLTAKAEIMLKGRLFNLRPHEARHAVRNKTFVKVSDRYFKHFLPATDAVDDGPVTRDDNPEKIFSLWLQGEDNAPPLVKACARSVRQNCPEQQFVMLDEKSVFDYIELPGVIMDKRKNGKIEHAHFADIVRVELLHNHGGIWLDATCFVTRPIPGFIEEQDFFVYLAGSVFPRSFMQNCFIRARKGAYLLEAWRAMIRDYWKKEPDAFTYFMHQLLFKALVLNDPRAIARFAEMPHIDQDPTHGLWWAFGEKPFDRDLFERITAGSFFQKTAYNSPWANNPPAGSFADEMINRMYR